MTAALLTLAAFAAGLAAFTVRRRNMHLWLPSFVLRRPPARTGRPTHVHFLFADHFEPFWGAASRTTALARTRRWITGYSDVARRHADSDGRPPQHVHFYPEEEYDAEILDGLAELCRRGFGDVEVHLHHDGDTAEALEEKLVRFKNILYARHGLLRRGLTGEVEYGFIHGNWALDNSRPDGRWCGVNDELDVLKRTGCYADFTLPSAPSATQTRKINSLYFAHDGPGPKSHDDGVDAAAGAWDDDGLLMVQGPLALNWASRKWGLLPRIESGEISADNPPTAERVELWFRQGVHVRGRPDHLFVKVHAHGTQPENQRAFLERGLLDRLYTLLKQRAEASGFQIHYETAREMYDVIRRLTGAEAVKVSKVPTGAVAARDRPSLWDGAGA